MITFKDKDLLDKKAKGKLVKGEIKPRPEAPAKKLPKPPPEPEPEEEEEDDEEEEKEDRSSEEIGQLREMISIQQSQISSVAKQKSFMDDFGKRMFQMISAQQGQVSALGKKNPVAYEFQIQRDQNGFITKVIAIPRSGS